MSSSSRKKSSSLCSESGCRAPKHPNYDSWCREHGKKHLGKSASSRSLPRSKSKGRVKKDSSKSNLSRSSSRSSNGSSSVSRSASSKSILRNSGKLKDSVCNFHGCGNDREEMSKFCYDHIEVRHSCFPLLSFYVMIVSALCIFKHPEPITEGLLNATCLCALLLDYYYFVLHTIIVVDFSLILTQPLPQFDEEANLGESKSEHLRCHTCDGEFETGSAYITALGTTFHDGTCLVSRFSRFSHCSRVSFYSPSSSLPIASFSFHV